MGTPTGVGCRRFSLDSDGKNREDQENQENQEDQEDQERLATDDYTDTATDSTDSFRVAPKLLAQRALILLLEQPLGMLREAS